ncbi:MAG: sugar nucleotide-binding protein, partial [Chitinivibrionales bacterium]|nr:sugar nucleotide-binding protein [Chitinivibrionales bacterium]MBD3358049.1 sugar nucleotide-binding protein [Chitinivibrionales bacterium]
INAVGTRSIVEVFGESSHITYLSTDLVFSGNSPPVGGYSETDTPDPVSVAGATFVHAENHIRQAPSWTIIRLGLPLGPSVTGDKGAVDWIESRFVRDLPVTLFYDEYRSCISCAEIARITLSALLNGLKGLYHLGGPNSWSLFEVGKRVLSRASYPSHLLTGLRRHQEKEGPPRIGDVSLDSRLIETALGDTITPVTDIRAPGPCVSSDVPPVSVRCRGKQTN